MPDLTTQLEQIRTALDAKRGQASQAWAAFVKLRDSAVAEGVDLAGDADAFAKLDEAGKAYDALRDEASSLESRWVRLAELAGLDSGEPRRPFEANGHPERNTTRVSFGEAFAASDVYRQLKASGQLDNAELPMGTTPAVKVADRAELKTLVTSAPTSGGAFLDPNRDTFVALPRRPPRVLDFIGVGETDTEQVEWVEQTSRTNAAAETAEATATNDGSGAAPESAVAYALRSTTVRDITHFIPATKRVLADEGQLRTLIEQELVDGVRERLENQVLSGNGTAPNLRGILNTTGILTVARGTDSRSDAVHKAITAIRLEFFEPVVVGLHPNDAQDVYLEKDANGNYIYGPPSQPGPRTIWGLTPVVSPVFAEGTALVGDYRLGSTLYLREGLSVAASDSHSDFFIRRMVAVLAVLRAAFAVRRPKCFATVTGM